MDKGIQRKRNPVLVPNWAAMDTDSLCAIFDRLPFVDLQRVKSICWGWHDAAHLFKRCSPSSSSPEMPWLVFTPLQDDEVIDGERAGRFVNIEENRVYPFNDLALQKINDGCCYCIGSSHDWLVCLDANALPYLLNPFTSHRIELPSLVLSLGFHSVHETGNKCYINDDLQEYSLGRNNIVIKAVLSSSPSLDRNYYLVIIYESYFMGYVDFNLAFCKGGDTSWTQLDGHNYNDIIFHDNQLYGLYEELGFESSYWLRVWDMKQDGFFLVRNVDLVFEIFSTVPDITRVRVDRFKLYLVECQGNLLVVSRFIDEKPESLRCLDKNHLYFGRCRTSQFNVFKLELDQNSWSGVTSLCGFALFLGKNQSISIDVRNCKMFKQDSVYFTDDYQQHCLTFGCGHDSGVFSLEDNSVDWLCGNKIENRRSGSTWVVPLVKRLG